MRVASFKLGSLVIALAMFAGLAGVNRAQADELYAKSPYQKFNYTFNGHDYTPGGSGSIGSGTSLLNGATLPFLYCIDIPDDIIVPGDYTNATVTTNGIAKFGNKNNGNPFADGSGGFVTVGGSATIAGQVAWLVSNEGYLATTATQQEALQAAIWTVIYGNKFSVDTAGQSAIISQMNTYLTALGGNTAAPSSVLWISPNGGESTRDNSVLQAVVTVPVPEPSAFAIAGLGALGFLGYGWKRRKSSRI